MKHKQIHLLREAPEKWTDKRAWKDVGNVCDFQCEWVKVSSNLVRKFITFQDRKLEQYIFQERSLGVVQWGAGASAAQRTGERLRTKAAYEA